MKIRIFVLSGKRGGYGALRPFLKRINNSKNFELTLALTDQHLSEKFGYTLEQEKVLQTSRFEKWRNYIGFW